ncbi:MAG: carbonate dehydratase [Gammaproteobacteria bacterium]|nr:carbonate dehydratase [Gammaproteobacteria bacterium]
MSYLRQLLENNRAWAAKTTAQDPSYFKKLAAIQAPAYLWIGCSDSRVPANQITGLEPGEVFVHRNVANVVVHTDLNCLSVIQYAVDVLRVKHIIVCGHYGCGGVNSALHGQHLGLIDNWLRHVEDIRDKHTSSLAPLSTQAKWDRLCELNVIEQVMHVCRTSVMRDAWARGQNVTVHGWVYGLSDGLLHDLRVSLNNEGDVDSRYQDAVAAILAKK